jgi:hypothetical protein
MKVKYSLLIIAGILLYLLYNVCIQQDCSEGFFLVVLGLILLIITTFMKTPKLSDQDKKDVFEGYCCETCGADYNCCCHSKLEEYTLIQKSGKSVC